MTLLHLLSYAGGLAAFLFVTLSLASGLLWLAELIEEHSRNAKVVGQRAIYAIIILHALLYIFDRLPLLPILFSILAHLVYLSNFTPSWPYISLASPRFLLSCVLVVADHFIWFFHFSAVAAEAKKYRGARYRPAAASAAQKDAPTFLDVAAFFGICVWAVPLFLFLSLSANDNVIPSFGSHVNLSSPSGLRPTSTRRSTSLVKSILAPLLSLLPRLRRKQAADGLIAPRTPIRGSPLPSPVSSAPTPYFPWDGGAGAGTGSPGGPAYGGGFGRPGSSASQRGVTPPPPRRIASEAQMTGTHPRAVGPRNGIPPFAAAADDDVGAALRTGLGTAGRRSVSRPTSPAGISLGPGVAAHEVDARRKAD